MTTVELYTLDGGANDVKMGEVRFDGGAISTAEVGEKYADLMAGISKTAIEVDGQWIDPKKEPQRFIENLWKRFHSPFLRASEPRES